MEGMNTALTLDQLFSAYMRDKIGLKQSTRSHYHYMYDTYIAPTLGKRCIAGIRYTDIRRFYTEMTQRGVLRRDQKSGTFRQGDALCAGSIGVIQAILRPLFADAVRDGYLSVNPCDRAMLEVRHFEKKDRAQNSPLKRTHRKALTEQEQAVLMAFLRTSARYRHLLPLFILFLGTGCRVGELIGLRWEDCDFQNNQISINHGAVALSN